MKIWQIKLDRRKHLGLFAATLFSIGSIVGGGIFALTGLAIKDSGYLSLVSFFIAFVLILISALSYSQLSIIYPSDGGGYLFAKELLGNFWGFLTGWGIYISSCIFIAFVLHIFGIYLSEFFIHSFSIVNASIIAFIILFIAAVFNISETGWFEGTLVFFNILILIIFIVTGLFHIQGFSSNYHASNFNSIFSTIEIIFISFMGFQAITNISQEVDSPKKNIPRAIFISLFSVLILYILIDVVVLSVLKVNFGVSSVMLAAEKVMGPFSILLPISALISTLSAGNSNMIASSKTIIFMSDEKQISNKFSKVNKFGSPYISLIFLAIVVLSFLFFSNTIFLVDVAAVLVIFLFILINLSSFIFNIKYKHIRDRKSFRLFSDYIPLLGVIFSLFMFFYISIITFEVACILFFIGIIYYELEKKSFFDRIYKFIKFRNG